MMALRIGSKKLVTTFAAPTFPTFAARAATLVPKQAEKSKHEQYVKYGLFGAAVVGGVVANAAAVSANEDVLHYNHMPWSHNGVTEGFDHASIRRGYQVYRGVCSTCHSLNQIAWRHMQDVCYTEAELKEMAAEVEYDEPPDAEGNVEQRPGKLFDFMPRPYETEVAARSANAGALPPDLSLIVKARHGGADYVFSLITGYKDEVPAGVEVAEGQYYNPYFAGQKIAMAAPITMDGQVEYDDGTDATISQMAKDVSVFLNWAAEPELDDRKLMGIKWIAGGLILCALLGYRKRFTWSLMKGRKLEFY